MLILIQAFSLQPMAYSRSLQSCH